MDLPCLRGVHHRTIFPEQRAAIDLRIHLKALGRVNMIFKGSREGSSSKKERLQAIAHEPGHH
jgi:hypothetical protein